MKTKRLHTVGKVSVNQQDVCGNCFSWVEEIDSYCWSCGMEFDENSCYSMESYKDWVAQESR